jgi:hypothetical protein
MLPSSRKWTRSRTAKALKIAVGIVLVLALGTVYELMNPQRTNLGIVVEKSVVTSTCPPQTVQPNVCTISPRTTTEVFHKIITNQDLVKEAQQALDGLTRDWWSGCGSACGPSCGGLGLGTNYEYTFTLTRLGVPMDIYTGWLCGADWWQLTTLWTPFTGGAVGNFGSSGLMDVLHQQTGMPIGHT